MDEAATVSPSTAQPQVREDEPSGTTAGSAAPGHHGGNPPFVPTPDQRRDVEAWVRAGCTAVDIGILLDVNERTVRRHFKRELELGRAKLKVALGGKLVKMALEGDKGALIFWLRTQAKWNVRVEHTGADGGPIQTYDLSPFALDEKRLLLGVIDQLLAQHGGEEAHGDNAGPGQRPALN